MIKRPYYEEREEYMLDFDTHNASFIALASILRRKGVDNWGFFLKLYDEDLQGIDPFSEEVLHDPRMQFKIVMECKKNMWYFIREVMRIPAPGEPMRFKLHRGNLALLWACENNIPSYEILPRQHGKTWAVISYALWVFNYASDYTNMLFMNKSLGDSQLNLKRLKDARGLLPVYMRMDRELTIKGEMKESKGNINSLKNTLNNEITVKASARNPIAADELGRGMTVAWVWIDELAFVQFNRIIYAAMAPAWSKAAEISISKNRPIGKILTTTPSDLSTDMGMFAYQIKDDAAKFTEELFDMDPSELSTWMEKNSKNGYLYIEYNYLQLGDSTKWFEAQCKDLLYDWAKIRREILLQWNNASTNSPFDENDLRDLRSKMLRPIEDKCITINKYYKLNVYRDLSPEKKYIITVDPAKGRGTQSDRTAITVIDSKTRECCAIFKSSTIQYKETFRFLFTLVNEYIPNCVLVIENNIDTLIEYVMNSSLRTLLYYEFASNVTKEKRKKGVRVHDQRNNILYGLNTNSQNRPKYFDILFELVRNNQELINCEELIEEIELLEYKTATRIEAVSGQHDDVIISYLLGLYVLMYGNNKPRFGLLYADDLGTEYKPVTTNIFSSNKSNAFSHINKERELSLLDNPFWADMLAEMNDSAEDMEYRWKKSLARSKDELLDMTASIFSGTKDEYGIAHANSNAFFDLNSREDKLSSDDLFEALGSDFVRDFEDDGFSGWFK